MDIDFRKNLLERKGISNDLYLFSLSRISSNMYIIYVCVCIYIYAYVHAEDSKTFEFCRQHPSRDHEGYLRTTEPVGH